MAKKTVSPFQNPLDWFLDTDAEDWGSLTILARKIAAEPFDEDSFRADLEAKLGRLKYQPSARLTGDEKTFCTILTDAGVLNVLLEPSMLRELWKCTLLTKIVQSDRQLKKEKRAIDGKEVRFHSENVRQLRKAMATTEDIGERFGARDEAEELFEKLHSEFFEHMRIQKISMPYGTARGELLSGRPTDGRSHIPRDEYTATNLAIYWTLKQKLQTTANKKLGIFDIFLCQLAELISAPRDVAGLSDGQALYRASKRSP